MSSLSARLLISVSVLLLFFFGVTIVVLNTAFRSAGEQSREDVLDGHLMALLAAAEPTGQGELEMPVDLHDPRLSSIGSGLYAEIRNTGGVVRWRSRSALGNEMPSGAISQEGSRLFEKESLTDGTPILILSLPVQWEFPDGELKPFVFRVAESMDSFNAQVARFRKQLSYWRFPHCCEACFVPCGKLRLRLAR
jgi:two-component system sensor histidine kinase PhoQ